MSAESPRHVRSGGPLLVPSQPPSDRSLIHAVSGFINDVTLSSSSAVDPKDVIQWARFETADINEPTPEGDTDDDASPLLLILGYGSGVQVWLIPPSGDAQEVLSWRQGVVRVLRILPTPQQNDCFASKRPLIALCDSASPGPTFCALSFISIRGGEQVKSIKFKNPILDVLANKRSIVVSFSERFAVFDAATLEDRMAVTTCYPCPCPLGGSLPVNPLALGERWLAYADKKLNQSKRSSGGCEGEGVTSYTATVLHAAKSLSKGLRGLGETVASSLSGGRSTSQSPSPPNTDIQQPGVITILDIEGNEEEDGQDTEEPCDPIIAHFIAHSEAIIALKFDASGMLLVTADRRGHDFHVFRIHPHPCGPHLASVHHLYILHRGDTTAKVQDISVSRDARWAAVSSLRGTTHVFAMAPYGGACGVRTHTAPRVVNRLSRFHRSAGLHIHATGKRQAAQSHEVGGWFPNPRLPPYPLPAASPPLAQLRPTHNIPTLPTHTITRTSSGRQRLSSVSEEGAAPLLARAQFGPARGAGGAGGTALYLLPPSGALLQLLLHPKPSSGVPKEKVSDETPIELEVEAVAQWPLQRPPAAADLLAPLPPANPLLQPVACRRCSDICMSEEERWLSQVEIVTHAGPHRRLWMGPQFVFKTYNCGSNSSLSEAETVEVETIAARGVARSNPVNMPGVRPIVPVLIDSGSASSLEHSPSDSFRRKSLLAESGRAASVCDVQLREDLAEAMKEDHGQAQFRDVTPRGAVSRAVDNCGTVVLQPEVLQPPEPDETISNNADEDTFRPFLPQTSLPPPAPVAPAFPLPAGTTIPVQYAPPSRTSAPAPAHELPTAVVIPAALEPVLSFREGDDGIIIDRQRQVEIVVPDVEVPRVKTPELPKIVEEVLAPEALPLPSEPRFRVRRSPTPVSRTDDGSNRKSSKIRAKDVKDNKNHPSPKPVEEPTRVKEMDVAAKEVREPTRLKEMEIPAKEVREPTRVKEMEIPAKEVREPTRVKEMEVPAKEVLESTKVKVKEMEIPTKEVREPTRVKEMEVAPKEVRESSRVKEIEATPKEIREPKRVKEMDLPAEEVREPTPELEKVSENIPVSRMSIPKETVATVDAQDFPSLSVTVKMPKKKSPEPKYTKTEDIKSESKYSKVEDVKTEPKYKAEDIKTEEQAWDMLLNETENPISSFTTAIEETKPKTKKNRKTRKVQDDASPKNEEDTFVEIHAIEEQKQQSSKLISISTPFEDIIEPTFLAKAKKSRSPKNVTPEREPFESKCDVSDVWSINELEFDSNPIVKYNEDDRETFKSNISFDIPKETKVLKKSSDSLKVSDEVEILPPKESPRTKKNKSLSPYSDRKPEKRYDTEIKDVYVIDTMKEEFPEIQITKGKRKKSPQPEKRERKDVEIERPIKSWSSIAACKSAKTDEREEKAVTVQTDIEKVVKNDEISGSSIQVSLQEKLYELCKRTDIMVAQCDTPTKLNFVDEHHSVLDLPPLEPLDFGLDDFNLEVMRDSLLDLNDPKITSPICKINIDSILSTIKETTSKAIEASAFNLIDLEKVPVKKEKGFSVVQNDKIRSHEVKVDDDKDVMEKSSDDDNTSPVTSTDSDKETKTGACVTMPSTKQSNKNKKSRKKKK